MNERLWKKEIELDRDIQREFLEWKEKRHQVVLQVEGPRQVGKTHETKKFAYNHYDQVIYVNLVMDRYGFEDCLSEPDFMKSYCEKAGIESFQDDDHTVLIIDEVQERAPVYNAIREIRERLSCDIIVSGSYLARTVNSKDFFLPAGICYLRVPTISFQEFCRALGIENQYKTVDLYGESVGADYDALQSAYEVYRRIGGYPEVVTTYLKYRNLDVCMGVLTNLLQTFTSESSRFFTNSTALSIFQEVYKSVFVEMSEEKKGTGKNLIEQTTNFVKDSVKDPVSRNEVRSAAAWLLYSGITGYCDLYNNGDVTDIVSNRRIYFMDTGIANYVSTLVSVRKDAVEGLLTETFAYDELNRLYQMTPGKKLVKGDKPCFSTCGDYELDFVVVDREDRRTGVEVKTSDNKAKSLIFYKEKGLIDRAVRALPAHGGHGKLTDTIPIYLIGRMLENDR